MKKFYLTTPIYYVNAKPHIGHAYTTLAADVLARYQKKTNPDAEIFFLTGTDEHGTKIAQAAQKSGQSEQAFCDSVSGEFQEAWKKLEIDYDYFIRTTSKAHKNFASDILVKLKEKGYLVEDSYKGYYCAGCEAFKNKRELEKGNICPDHKTKCEFISEKAWFFKLSEFENKVRDLIERDEIQILPIERKHEVLGFLKQGLANVAVSRQKVEWGIPLPWDKSQTIYVWIEALLNYLSALEINHKENLWPADLHLMSKDILRFHSVIWPALLLALEKELPKKIFVHGYFTINGQKMSKTIGNVISPDELVKRYGADAARYLILTEVVFGADGDISLEKLDKRYNSELADNLGNLLNRTLAMISKYNLEKPDNWRPELEIEIKKEISEFNFQAAGNHIFEFIAKANQKIDKTKPWEMFKLGKKAELENLFFDPQEGILSVLIAVAKAIDIFMPSTSKKILVQIESGKPKPLFEKIK